MHTSDGKHHKPHLLLQLLNDAEVALIVWTHGGLRAFAQLSDLALQLHVVPLQPAHLLQVAGQPVIQELHGLLLMAVEEAFAEGPADSEVAWNVAGARQGAGSAAAVGQRLGRPRGVVPTRTQLACARVAERPRGAAPACESGPLRRELQLMEVMAKTLALSTVGFARV